MGEPKQLLQFHGQSLLLHAVNEAVNANFSSVIVVLGANAAVLEKEINEKKVNIIENKEWKEGMATSVRLGLNTLLKINPSADAVIFMVCDQPFVSASLLKELIIKQRETGKPVVTSSYGETVGSPALFHKNMFQELLQLKGDAGARKIIEQHMSEVAIVSFPKGSIDIDTMKDYEGLFQLN
ncbi:MAG: nucleotidyltransferase family protein [Bacteroidia bacterium]|nr:nucleotidyltransferase family protein [Bacteroidia bacterium]